MTHQHEQPVVIFLHIQKNAGSTLYHVLLRNYGPNFSRRVLQRLLSGRPVNEGIPAAIRAVPLNARFIAGHFSFGVHRLVERPCRYLCMLRDPIERLVSLYYYSASTPSAYYHEHAVGRSARAFILETDLAELDNGQLRFLAGGSDDLFINRTPIGGCDQGLLEVAKTNAREHFFTLGLVERFDESLLLFKQELGWRDSYYVPRNVSRATRDSTEIDSKLLTEIADRNRLDLDLYAWARRRFERRLAELIPRSDEQLAAFRRSNRRFGLVRRPLTNLYDRTKALLDL